MNSYSYLTLLDVDVFDEYQLWDSIAALGVAITDPINAPQDKP